MPVAIDPDSERHAQIAEKRATGRRWSDPLIELQFEHIRESMEVMRRFPETLAKLDDKLDARSEKLGGDIALLASVVKDIQRDQRSTRELCESIKTATDARIQRRGALVIALITVSGTIVVALIGGAVAIIELAAK